MVHGKGTGQRPLRDQLALTAVSSRAVDAVFEPSLRAGAGCW